MTITELYEILRIGENEEIECKEASGGLPRDLWETYSAFANTNGGIILLGIEQKGDKFSVKGIKNRQILKEFWDIINNRQKVNINILSDKNISVLDIEGKEIISIDVPRADRREKPIYIGQNPMTGTYRRNFEGDYKCTDDEVKSMLADQSDISRDSKVLDNFGMNDINIDTLKNYRERFNAKRPTHPWIGLDNKEFLYKIGAWGRNRNTGEEGLTVAGLLTFGEERSITEEMNQYFLDYREKISNDPDIRWDYRITSTDGTWSGNIYDFYFKVINKITDNLNIPFKLIDLVRQEDTPVHKAMREALANALIHADYYGNQGIVIEKGKTYFRFSNPGTLRISIQEALKGGISDPRNPNIFRIFSLIGVGERQGFGLDNIQTAWKDQDWRSPELLEKYQPDRTTLVLRTVSLLPEESLRMLKEVLKEQYSKLSREEIMALVTAHQEEQVTNSRLQILCGKDSIELNKVLNGLVSKNLLVSEGQRRGMRYLLSDIFINNDSGINTNESVNNESNSVSNGVNSVNSKSNSVSNGINSVNNEDKIEAILSEISKPAREKKRLNPDDMKAIIIKMCSVRPLSLKELSNFLNRSADGIRVLYITPLVKDGRISPLYEGQKNHPKQAYKAVK